MGFDVLQQPFCAGCLRDELEPVPDEDRVVGPSQPINASCENQEMVHLPLGKFMARGLPPAAKDVSQVVGRLSHSTTLALTLKQIEVLQRRPAREHAKATRMIDVGCERRG